MTGSDRFMRQGDVLLPPLSASARLLKDPPLEDKYSQSSAPTPALVPAKLETIYAECARFVWLTLQRLGVRQADLDDVCHDVFLIVQRKLPEFRAGAELRPWLLGICARTAANYRRRSRIRMEQTNTGSNGQDLVIAAAPEIEQPDHELLRRRALEVAEAILSGMSPVKRAVFIMFEIEGVSCHDIATELGLPIGTVYSRLHSARKIFLQQATRRAVVRGVRHG